MSIAYDFTKEPSELVEYLKSKGLQTTFNYEEMLHEAHQKAFTVAKVTKLDLLSDIHSSLGDALKEGKPFSQWQDEIKPTLEKKGWWGEVEAIDPRTGEVKNIFVGSRRLKTIYDTNMRTAYAKGRYEAQMDSDAEYFYYSAVMDQLTRPGHAKIHGTLLPKSDPFWKTNYPPNGWRCRCKVRSYTKQEALKRGLKVSQTPPSVADKDWNYNPGKTDKLQELYKQKIDALSCKGTDCGFKDKAVEGFTDDLKTLAQSQILFKEVQSLFVEPNKKVELCKSDIYGKEKSVILSSDTVQSHTHREEINAFDYSLIPLMLEGEKRVFVQDEKRLIILKRYGKNYRLTLKDIQNTDEIYAVSLVDLSGNFENELKKLIKKYEEL